jgi:hypothetical protein
MSPKAPPIRFSEFPLWLKLPLAAGLLGVVACALLRVNVDFAFALVLSAIAIGYWIRRS